MSSIKLWLVEGRRASRGEVVEAGGGAALVLAVLTHHHPPRPCSRAGPPRRHKLVIGLIAAPGREGSRLSNRLSVELHCTLQTNYTINVQRYK